MCVQLCVCATVCVGELSVCDCLIMCVCVGERANTLLCLARWREMCHLFKCMHIYLYTYVDGRVVGCMDCNDCGE